MVLDRDLRRPATGRHHQIGVRSPSIPSEAASESSRSGSRRDPEHPGHSETTTPLRRIQSSIVLKGLAELPDISRGTDSTESNRHLDEP